MSIAVGLWTAGAWRPFDPASLPAALLPTLRYTAQRAASWPSKAGAHYRTPEHLRRVKSRVLNGRSAYFEDSRAVYRFLFRRWSPSHVHLHDRPHFHGAFNLEYGAALRKLYGLVQVARFDQREPTYDVFSFGKRPVSHSLLFPFYQFARAFKRLTPVLDMTVLCEVLEPSHPFLDHLLRSLGRPSRLATAVKIYELAHGDSSSGLAFRPLDVWEGRRRTSFFRTFAASLVGRCSIILNWCRS